MKRIMGNFLGPEHQGADVVAHDLGAEQSGQAPVVSPPAELGMLPARFPGVPRFLASLLAARLRARAEGRDL